MSLRNKNTARNPRALLPVPSTSFLFTCVSVRTCFTYCRAVIDVNGIKHFQAGTYDVTLHIISDVSRPFYNLKPVLSDHSKENNKVSFQDW